MTTSMLNESPFGTAAPSVRRRWIFVGGFALLLLAALVTVWLATRDRGDAPGTSATGHNHGAAPAAEASEPVMLSATEARRIGVTYAAVERGALPIEVRSVAQVTFDETKVTAVAPKIDGWVEQLYVNTTGQAVERGAALLAIYSPMLVSAQQELILASKLARDVASGTEEARASAKELRESARRRLLLWDVPASTVDRIERTGEPEKTVVLRTPAGGVVLQKNVLAGQRVMAGDALYKVADLSAVWVEGDVFEQDLPSVRLGQSVTADFQALPGAPRSGRITYVYPTLDPETRTAKIRVALANPGLRLKPGMYATIRIAAHGTSSALTIPRSAVLSTGERNLVFVKRRDGMLEPRYVQLGAASDERVQVLGGVAAGDNHRLLGDLPRRRGVEPRRRVRRDGRHAGDGHDDAGAEAGRGAAAGREAMKRVIEWSVRNRVVVALFVLVAVVGGIIALRRTPLEALPDLSDVQVIVQADYGEQAPRIVEDQVTYPIAAEMLKVPGARTVRGYSFFGVSFVYVIFEDGTDLYWARSRVLEYLSGIKAKLPESVTPTLGPDATGLGWVYQYALEDTTGRLNFAELRSLQDWHLRYALTSVSGVSEVASVGGFEKQYQVDIDPAKLLAYGIPVTRVMSAIQNANSDVGAMVMELSEREYMVRGLGYLKSIGDIENIVVGATSGGTPVRVTELGTVKVGPAVRRGIADLDGRGDAVGGIVVMRFGENALATIERVKAKLAEVEKGLPAGVVVRPVYDRSELIRASIATLRGKLLEESLIVALVCVLFLLHARSALVAILTLPIGILMAFIAMRLVGVGADIMSLGGIAIAIGAMIDAAIVMIENMHKHLERAVDAKVRATGAAVGGALDTGLLTTAERWRVVVEASREVGPSLFFSLLIITVSFLPVFTLGGQEGRLFKPLAFTKTFAMAAASLLSVTFVPVAMGIFIRGRVHREAANPVNRALIRAYRPLITFVLRHRWPVVGAALLTLVLTWIPWKKMGSEFMPPLDEGTILYMPTTLPGISIARAREILRIQDSLLKSFPEVEHVWGKSGAPRRRPIPRGSTCSRRRSP